MTRKNYSRILSVHLLVSTLLIGSNAQAKDERPPCLTLDVGDADADADANPDADPIEIISVLPQVYMPEIRPPAPTDYNTPRPTFGDPINIRALLDLLNESDDEEDIAGDY